MLIFLWDKLKSKLLLFNKYDKVSKMELAEYIQKKSTQLQSFQGKFKMDV